MPVLLDRNYCVIVTHATKRLPSDVEPMAFFNNREFSIRAWRPHDRRRLSTTRNAVDVTRLPIFAVSAQRLHAQRFRASQRTHQASRHKGRIALSERGGLPVSGERCNTL